MKRTEPVRAARGSGSVRIIGGSLRGSRLQVPDRPGLRPTADRVRETLFNWLAPVLPGAECLDLFAGSGALGFEAVSRGAARVTLLERDPALAAALSASAARLKLQNARVLCVDALAWLRRDAAERFDLAFVDPPFDAALLQDAIDALAPRLTEEAWVYLECGGAQAFELPPNWALHRSGETREVRYALYRVRQTTSEVPSSR